MKIDPSNIESIYSSAYGKTYSKKSKSVESSRSVSVDTATLSVSRDSLSDVKSSALAETKKGTEPDRLRQLCASVANGSYSVSGKDIAEALLR